MIALVSSGEKSPALSNSKSSSNPLSTRSCTTSAMMSSVSDQIINEMDKKTWRNNPTRFGKQNTWRGISHLLQDRERENQNFTRKPESSLCSSHIIVINCYRTRKKAEGKVETLVRIHLPHYWCPNQNSGWRRQTPVQETPGQGDFVTSHVTRLLRESELVELSFPTLSNFHKFVHNSWIIRFLSICLSKWSDRKSSRDNVE